MEIENKKTYEINFLASFSSAGGGEQSAKKMIEVFRTAGWTVNAWAWDKIHADHQGIGLLGDRNKLISSQQSSVGSLPLIVIGNDQVYEMPKDEAFRKIVEQSKSVILVVNWAVGELPKLHFLTEKLRAVIFHNSEKIKDWKNKAGTNQVSDRNLVYDYELIPFIGAIEIDRFLGHSIPRRGEKEPLVVIKHGVSDKRKYVCKDTQGKGEKVHLWQKYCHKELDIDFYSRLFKNLAKYRPIFKFMAAPAELQEHFKDNPNFVFYKWNEVSVDEFLASGHIYLDRCSDEWRHNYPRTLAEAMSAGLPAIVEDRDGWADRIDNGDTGFLCCHYNDFQDKVDLLARKEEYRYAMGSNAREYAKGNLRPERWVNLVAGLLDG